MTKWKVCSHDALEICVQTKYVTYYRCIDCGKYVIEPPIKDWRLKGDKWME